MAVQSSAAPEIMRLSEIPRIDILEHEPGDESHISSTLFDMLGASQFSSSSAHNIDNVNSTNNSSSSSLHQKSIFPEITAFSEHATAGVDEGGGEEPGFGSFQFLSRSGFAEKEKEDHQGVSLQASPSSIDIEAPGITKLWTDYDEDGAEQHGSYTSLDNNENTTTNNNRTASFKTNSSWGGASRSSSVLEPTTTRKPKRKRSRPCKSSEEVESQRMTHIAVERNRRRQMNEHLRVLRALMPGSYVQRGDQASIIGGAIEFVKELQQLLQCLEEQKKRKMSFVEAPPRMLGSPTTIIQAVATGFPAFTGAALRSSPPPDVKYLETGLYEPLREVYGEAKSELAQVEVKIVGTVANIKILSQKKPGQLLKTMTALENKLLFSIVHTNVTTIDQTVLYSFEVKIGQNCELANEIAEFIHDILVSN